MTHKKPQYKNEPINRTLFKMSVHYKIASKALKALLLGKVGELEIGEDSKVHFGTVLDAIVELHPNLSYLEFEHVVEIYLRHAPTHFILEGENIVSLVPRNFGETVEPPETLYYGTVQGVADRAMVEGLHSHKNDCVTMSENKVSAERRARQFAGSTKDIPILLTVAAGEAQDSGVDFKAGNRNSLFMASEINKKFLTSEIVSPEH